MLPHADARREEVGVECRGDLRRQPALRHAGRLDHLRPPVEQLRRRLQPVAQGAGPHRPQRDIVRARLRRRHGAVPRRAAMGADDALRPQRLARLADGGGRGVGQVHAVQPVRRHQPHVVRDGQRHVARGAHRPQRIRRAPDRVLARLEAEAHAGDRRGVERGLQRLGEGAGLERGGGDEIETGGHDAGRPLMLKHRSPRPSPRRGEGGANGTACASSPNRAPSAHFAPPLPAGERVGVRGGRRLMLACAAWVASRAAPSRSPRTETPAPRCSRPA